MKRDFWLCLRKKEEGDEYGRNFHHGYHKHYNRRSSAMYCYKWRTHLFGGSDSRFNFFIRLHSGK